MNITKLSCLAFAGALASSVCADTLTYDMNTDGNFESGFSSPYTGTQVSQQADGGLGFATDPNASVNRYAMPETGSFGYFAVISQNNTLISPELYGSTGYIANESGPEESFVDGNWYYMDFGMELVSGNTFEFSWNLNNSDDDGSLGSSLLTGSVEQEFEGLNDTLYTYIGMENPTSTGSRTAIDNITLDSTAPISVPEPSTVSLLGLSSLGALILRRSRA